MKKIIFTILSACMFTAIQPSFAQRAPSAPSDELVKPYNPNANAQADIDSLLQQAKSEHKNIILQAGGNWCIWCLRFNDYIHRDAEVSAFLEKNFLYYHLNFSKENKNEAVFQKYAPQGAKLGYPFFIILNDQGDVLEVHDSGSLEEGKGYDKQKVLDFFGQHVQS